MDQAHASPNGRTPKADDPAYHVGRPGSAPVAKVERYGWTVRDKPGTLRWLPKDQINVDRRYQREHDNHRKIIRLASRWSWVACGCINVARRPDGSLYAMDGFHRVLAAMRRSDIEQLPCIVFDVATVEQEAAGYLATNTDRNGLKSVEKFKAKLEAADPLALQVVDLLAPHALTYGGTTGDPRTVRCINELERQMAKDPDVLRDVFPTILEACTASRSRTASSRRPAPSSGPSASTAAPCSPRPSASASWRWAWRASRPPAPRPSPSWAAPATASTPRASSWR